MGCCACCQCCFSSKAPEMPEELKEKMGPSFVNSNGFRIVTRLEKGGIQKPEFIWAQITGLGAHSWAEYDHKNTIEGANANNGWWVCIDKQGNGYSEGFRNYQDDYSVDIEDAITMINMMYDMPEVDEDTPLYIFGESQGGMLATILGLEIQENQSRVRGNFKGAILLCPALNNDDGPSGCERWALVNCVLPCFPHFLIRDDAITPEMCFSDPDCAAQAKADKIYNQPIPVATGNQFLVAWDYIIPRLGDVEFPFFLGHGGEDVVVNPKASESLWSQCKTPIEQRAFWKPKEYFHSMTAEKTFGEEGIPRIIQWMKSFTPVTAVA